MIDNYLLFGMFLALLSALPLAWKWQLGMLRIGMTVALLAVLAGLLVSTAAHVVAMGGGMRAVLVWFLAIGFALALLAYRFYRDPERTPPGREDVIISPADGNVIYVRESRNGVLPSSAKNGRNYKLAELTRTSLHSDAAIVVGISMSFLDVHINRTPLAGRVTFQRHFPGLFGSLRLAEMVFKNERATTVFEGNGLQVAVVQIASRLVRQIAVFVREGQDVQLGQRMGVIRLGSQVDVVMPALENLKVLVKAGERVRAGESILAVLEGGSGSRGSGGREGPAELIARRAAPPPSRQRSQTTGALVIGGNYRALAIARSLGRHRVPVWVTTSRQERLASLSRYTQRALLWPEGSAEDQVSSLLELADRHCLDGWLLFPTGDQSAALLSRYHARLSERFRVTTPAWEVMRWAYDKRLTYQVAAESGVDVPWTLNPQSEADLAAVRCEFPVILKPAMKTRLNRFTEDKAWPAGDRETLRSRYREACSLVLSEIIMVQEMIPGDGATQLSFTALCSEGQPLAWVTARRTRQYPIDFGHSSCFVETMDLPEIEPPARRLLSAIRYSGLVEIEFKYDRRDGRFKLLDINPRIWTWISLCRRAGVDYPYLLWRLMLGEPVSGLSGRAGVRWIRMSTDLPAAFQEMRRGRLSFGNYLRSLGGPLEFAVMAADDPLPGLLDLPLLALSYGKRWVTRAGRERIPTDEV